MLPPLRLTRFLSAVGDSLDALTFHHYYVHASVARLADYVKPRILNKFRDAIKGIKRVLSWVPTGEDEVMREIGD